MMNDSIAILIDCWKRKKSNLNLNILDFINNSPFIKTIILASYNGRIEPRNLWYQNYEDLFNSADTPAEITNLYRQYNTLFYRTENALPHQTDPGILNFVNKDKFQIAMHRKWELEYYLELHPNQKNIFVFGGAWSICVQERPLGILNLLNIENINIFTKTSCIIDLITPIPDPIPLPWTLIDSDIYQLTKHIDI